MTAGEVNRTVVRGIFRNDREGIPGPFPQRELDDDSGLMTVILNPS
jgi:hypothetical protein